MNKPYFYGSIAVALAFILGALAMWGYQEARQDKPVVADEFFDSMFSDRFFERSRDPFQEMERMRAEMERLFSDDRFDAPFERWFGDRFGGIEAGAISVEDKDDAIVYRLNTGDRDLVDVQVDVADGYISIDATMEDRTSASASVSRLSQRFPVPPEVDPASARVEQDEGEITIRLDKIVS